MMNKRFLSIVLAIIMLLSCLPAQASAEMTLVINGEEAAFTDAQGNPLENMLVEGRLHAPVVAMGQYLGLDIAADAAAKTITLEGKPLTLMSGGTAVEPAVMDGVVYVPVLAFASALDDCTVDIVGGQYHISVKGATEYRQGLAALQAGEYADARTLFGQAGDYADAAERISEAWYSEAEALLKQENYEAASNAFVSAGSYKDAAARVTEPWYAQGQKLQAEGKLTEAAAAYAKAGQYQDAPTLAVQVLDQAAASMISSGDYKGAYAIFAEAGSTESIRQLFYRMAQAKQAAGETEIALACYELAGDYADAKAQSLVICYETAVALEAADKTAEAIEAYKALGDYQDARDKWKQLTYELARKYQNSEKYDEAYALYDTIRGYSDVDNRLKNSSGLKNAAKRAASAAAINSIQVGDSFTYGSYVHVGSTNKNKQPIVWQVLQKDGAKALVLAKYALAKKPFHSSNSKSVDWSSSSLRSWLNGSFINSAFTETERKAIVSTSLESKNNKEKYTKTSDKVFVLTYGEIIRLLAGKARATQWDKGSDSVAYGKSWTRDRYTRVTASSNAYATVITVAGGSGFEKVTESLYVRPAMWLNLESTAVDWSKYIKPDAVANKYAVIERLIAAGKYQDALTKLGKEDASAEVTRLIRECRYQMGLDDMRTGDLTGAAQHLTQVKHFSYRHSEALLNIIDTIK